MKRLNSHGPHSHAKYAVSCITTRMSCTRCDHSATPGLIIPDFFSKECRCPPGSDQTHLVQCPVSHRDNNMGLGSHPSRARKFIALCYFWQQTPGILDGIQRHFGSEHGGSSQLHAGVLVLPLHSPRPQMNVCILAEILWMLHLGWEVLPCHIFCWGQRMLQTVIAHFTLSKYITMFVFFI